MRTKAMSSLVVLLSLTVNLFAQKTYTNTQFEFAIDKPIGWIELSGTELQAGFENLNLQDESLSNMIANHKGPILLTAYSKYDPASHISELIPKIQVSVIASGASSFDQFTNEITAGANSFKNHFEDFAFTSPVETVEISGVKSVHFSITFTLPTKEGNSWKVLSSTYAIPRGKFFFQVSLTDGQEMQDNAELFEKLVSSIVVGK